MLPCLIWLVDRDEDRKKFWKNYFRNHKEKIYYALKHSINIDTEQVKEDDFLSVWLGRHKEIRSLANGADWLKQVATYTNVIYGGVLNPTKLYNRQRALPWLKLAKLCFQRQNNYEPTELIIDHCKQAKKKRKKGESLTHYIGRLYFSNNKRNKKAV